MPPDNTATIAPGADVEFPNDGATSGGTITRIDATTFNLADIGTYYISFEVPVSEAGQLELIINGTSINETTSGRATGTSNISNAFIIETTSVNSTISLRNPAGNPTALTITPTAGGTAPSSAHLTIIQLN